MKRQADPLHGNLHSCLRRYDRSIHSAVSIRLNLPNVLTLIRMPLTFAIVALMYGTWQWAATLACGLFVCAAVTDWLAGKLARANVLTPESTHEQQSAGLDRLTSAQLGQLEKAPVSVTAPGGAATLSFTLPRQAVSLLVFQW